MTDKNANELDSSRTQEWRQLSPAQKRDQRILRWQSTAKEIKFVDDAAESDYKTRTQRLVDVYNVREPDRVPVLYYLAQMPFQLYGTNYHAGIYDYKKAAQAYDRFNAEHALELECFTSPTILPPGKVLEMLDYKMYVWPGHGLSKDAKEIQFVENEYMKADEYDDLILNPSDFWMRVFLPRVFGAFESFSMLDSLTDIVEFPVMQLGVLTKPGLLTTLQKILDAGKELQKRERTLEVFASRGLEHGYPVVPSWLGLAPFDILGDTLRGTKGIMMDMYRQPDKLQEAMDVIAKLLIKSALAHANAVNELMVSFPLHKGADGWMSQKQFEKFYWPSLRKVINAFVDEGLMVSLFAEGSYNTRLDSVNEFPKGSVHWSFDQTDMANAKKVLGDRCCVQGNVPSSMLITGTPVEVKEYCRGLIETCGRGGGFILSPGAGGSEVKLENLKAMVQAAREYGVYKKQKI